MSGLILASLLSLEKAQLEQWASPGLYKRAVKKLEETQFIPSLSEELLEAQIEGFQIKVNKPGLTGFRCDCPASGPCVHILMFVLKLQQERPNNKITEEAAEIPLTQNLDQIDQNKMIKDIGKSLCKRAFLFLADFQPTVRKTDPESYEISFPFQKTICTWKIGQHWQDVLVMCEAKDRMILQAATLLAVLESEQILKPEIWNRCKPSFKTETEENTDNGEQEDTEEILQDQVTSLIYKLASMGILHLDISTLYFLDALVMKAKASQEKKLAGLLDNLNAGIKSLARNEDVDAAELVRTMAIILHANSHRQESLEESGNEIISCKTIFTGSYWWENRNGSRGITGCFLNLSTGRIMTRTAARPGLSDPSFQRASAYTSISLFKGGQTAEFFCEGIYELKNMAITDQGRLIFDGTNAPEKAAGTAVLSEISMTDFDCTNPSADAQILKALLSERSAQHQFWPVTDYKKPILWESENMIVWNVTTARKQLRSVLIPASQEKSLRLKNLIETIEDKKIKIRGITVKPFYHAARYYWEPVSLLVEKGKTLISVSLDFINFPKWYTSNNKEKKLKVDSINLSDPALRQNIRTLLECLYTPCQTGRAYWNQLDVDQLKESRHFSMQAGWNIITHDLDRLIEDAQGPIPFPLIFDLILKLHGLLIVHDLG